MTNKNPLVAIVILNFNTRHFLEEFLPFFLRSSYGNSQIWVVDNASLDDSVEYLKNTFPDINLLQTPKNLGYAGGYAWALPQIAADYYAIVNSDIEVTENWLEPLVSKLEEDEQIAAVQPKILDYHKRSFFEYAGGSGGFLDKWCYAFCRGRLFDTLEEDKGQYNTAIPIFWASGACFVIKASAYHKVGGFDIDFFAHQEEIDLCWRIQAQGQKIWSVPSSVVFHVGGGTLQAGSTFKEFLNIRNSLYMLTKNYQGTTWFFVLLWRMILDGVYAMKFLVSGNISKFKTVINAHIAFWKKFNTQLTKRKVVQAAATSSVAFYPKSVVWEYFALQRKKFTELW